MSDQLSEWRQKAQELLGASNPVDWTSESRGYIVCPLRHLHTTANGVRDTFLYLEGFPHIHCLHESCHDELREINRFLRIQLTGKSTVTTDFARSQNYGMAEALRKNRDMVLEKYTPKVRELPRYVGPSVEWFLEHMFEPTDFIWIGQPEMTGSYWPHNFQMVKHWEAKPPSPAFKFICPNPIMGCDRKNENVAEYRHLVLESDTLTMLESRAMFEAVEDIFLLKLKAIVFSGNKSLHGWFAHPGLPWLALHQPVLVALGFDPKVMIPSQCVRLPGTVNPKTGKMQSLLWINQG
jgi:hypothetical protein